MSPLHKLLQNIREKANNDTELGNAFEQLSKVFLENDATQTQQYSQVWHFSDWAKEREEYSKVDIGIDLVAKLSEEEGFCAIQCKFYQPDHSISKADLDSFISASSSSDFKRLVLIDTSLQPIGKNAQKVFDNLTKVPLIVNASRGQVINEQDLIDALDHNKISGCALDVFETEPISSSSLLKNQKNVIFSSHNASNTYEANESVNSQVTDMILGWLNEQ